MMTRFFANRRLWASGLVLLMMMLPAPLAATPASEGDSLTYITVENVLYRDSTAADFSEYMAERCRLDIYYPAGQENYATVVWFHGGGLRGGERYIPQLLKGREMAVVAVGYRLYPEVSSPAFIEDAAAAVAWVFAHLGQYGGDRRLIFISGHSAGGYLASMVGLDGRWLQPYGIDINDIAGLIPFSGHTITHMTLRDERGIPHHQPIIDQYAPLFHVKAQAPPLVLITGDRQLELLGRYEENAYMWRMMKVADHQQTSLYELQGFDHGAMVDPACGLLIQHVRTISDQRREAAADQ